MNKVADLERIRLAFFRDDMKIREIARKYKVSRTTVRRALTDPGPWHYRRANARPAPVMAPVAAVITSWLEADKRAPRKQRHTAHRMYQRLVTEYGFAGGESTVRQYVRRVCGPKTGEVTIPLAHDIGAEAQIDFGNAEVRIAGIAVTAHLFMARLCYSTRDVVVAYPQEDRSAWLDGHVVAFETWDGVPETLWYDNPSTLGRIVQKRFVSCDEFSALRSAYRFRAHHCNPGEGHEKGLVEGLVGSFRRNHLVPVMDFPSWDALNQYLAKSALDDEALTRRNRPGTVAERFRAEQPRLGALPPKRFAACVDVPARVSRQQLVVCKERRYSVPLESVGRWVRVHLYAYRVEVWDRGRHVATHDRHDGQGDPICNFWHYVPALLRRPGAFSQAIPVRQASFPEEAQQLLDAVERRHPGDRVRAHREFLGACQLAIGRDMVRWRAACATAIARGDASCLGVKAALLGEPVPTQLATVLPPALAGVRVDPGDPAQYQQLLAAWA